MLFALLMTTASWIAIGGLLIVAIALVVYRLWVKYPPVEPNEVGAENAPD